METGRATWEIARPIIAVERQGQSP
jgi:hypothetical protein